MKLETTMHNIGRKLDQAISTVRTQAPDAVHNVRIGVSSALLRLAQRVRPK
jgi:hypothetical protein